jgi:hypothetical protein
MVQLELAPFRVRGVDGEVDPAVGKEGGSEGQDVAVAAWHAVDRDQIQLVNSFHGGDSSAVFFTSCLFSGRFSYHTIGYNR